MEEKKLAKQFHDTYERLAPQFGYETREDTKEFDENSPNGKLMIAVCKEVMLKELDRAMEEGFRNCYKEVLAMDSFGERMDMSRKESFRRLKNLLEDKIRLKLTTK